MAPWELLGFLFRLTDGDGLAGVADFEAGEAADRDILPQFANFGGDELRDADGLVFDKGLLVEADFFIELAHLAFDDFLDDLGRLTGRGCLRTINIFLALEGFGGYILFADEL